jgi:ABC-type uncharacterized transport system ATPase subunit
MEDARGSPVVSMRAILKRFSGVVANQEIDLDIRRGEIHALLGENGAGKSTLMKVLYGVYHPDGGEIRVGGSPVTIRSPHDARRYSIGMVFQDLRLVPAFTVAENIALFLPDLAAVPRRGEIRNRIRGLSGTYGLEVDPDAVVRGLSIGQQQKVELLKLLLSDARVLILDEPTRVLAEHEVAALFGTLRRLCADGYSVVLITHRMRDVLECADRITVLRQGRVAGSVLRPQATEQALVGMMFERELTRVRPGGARTVGASTVLELAGISTRAEGGGVSLRNVSLRVRSGEILGVAGVSGNGQRELADTVLGVTRSVAGRKILGGLDLTNKPVSAMRASGLGFVPEDPLSLAVVPFMSVVENMAITDTRGYARHGGLSMDWSAVREDLDAAADRIGMPVRRTAMARDLSGGNLQRLVIVRELGRLPRLVVASYITRGLDLQSATSAHQALVQARDQGAAVLLVSEDLEELFTLCDRLLVLYDGAVVGEFAPEETDVVEVGHLMTGSRRGDARGG